MGLGSALNVRAAETPVLHQPGFVHFYNNEYEAALRDFEAEVKAHPNDPNAYNKVAQTVLFREMYRDGALESELVTGSNPFLRRPKMDIAALDKKTFMAAINRALQLSRGALASNPDDRHALYAQVVSFGLRANFQFLVEKAWMSALSDATEARKADDRLLALAPGFVDAHLAHGMSEYVVGNLPAYLRMLGAIKGFHADREDGIRELQWVARDGTLDRYDARVMLAAIYRRDHHPRQAIPLLKDLAQTFPRNYLFRLEQVQMYSDVGDKQDALRMLAEVEDMRRGSAPGYAAIPPEKIQYLRANLLFWYGDLGPALDGMTRVAEHATDLDLNTAVMACLRLGQIYDLRGEHGNAVTAYRRAVSVAPKSEAALEAKEYISTPYRRKRAG
jgi:tetratricopeptide (TPR) repeat protein